MLASIRLAPIQSTATPAHSNRVSEYASSSTSRSGSITQRFGERLRALRKARGMTQHQLSDYMGIDRSFISDVERGKKRISLDYLDTLAQGFKLSLPEMLKGL